AMRVLLGTQSVRTVDPPRPSRSTRVTSAPSLRATSAASYPPGPPPMITTWVMVRLSRIRGSALEGVLGSRPPAFYRYLIYEHEVVDGVLRRTGRWVVVQIVIVWGDGKPNRGWLVTAHPVQTRSGAPATKDGKSWAPAWLSNSFVFGSVNNDILDSCTRHPRRTHGPLMTSPGRISPPPCSP